MSKVGCRRMAFSDWLGHVEYCLAKEGVQIPLDKFKKRLIEMWRDEEHPTDAARFARQWEGS